MFRVGNPGALEKKVESAESNYRIKKNDLLSLEVFTNGGEKIVDPNAESFKEAAVTQQPETRTYLVDVEGVVRLPLVQKLKLEGLTIKQAEELLEKEYQKFYREPFVVLKFANKRVVVLGSPGGQVIPLVNENTRLTEVLAMAKGIDINGKAHNIRVIRENEVFVADLSTIEGYRQNDMVVHPGDIVYVEPVRRPFSEGFREYGPIISIVTSLGTLVIVILQLDNR